MVAIWSDIHCPWAFVATHRLRQERDVRGLDVVFDQRAWPLELVNGRGIPEHIVPEEMTVLANHEPELFSRFRGDSWPSTSLPAFELVAAARRGYGMRAAEDVDYYLRLAFFRDSVNLSIRPALEQALKAAAEANPTLDPDKIIAIWNSEAVRVDVLDDYRRSAELPIEGSPQIFWPDGSTTHNPGMTDHEWVRGIPRIHSTDPTAPARLLREKVRLHDQSSG
jgi:predicted DsbA family dithiol-disulfide isomerase